MKNGFSLIKLKIFREEEDESKNDLPRNEGDEAPNFDTPKNDD